jgi:TolB-like protein/Tfp pilus assembly protein PilF
LALRDVSELGPPLPVTEGAGSVRSDAFRLIGCVLAGRFRIEHQVAEGGFGVVYKARQLTLDREVAVKVLKTGDCVSAEQRRLFHHTFAAEAHTIAHLRHPHIVEVHDFGVAQRPDGEALHWMALEWLEGRTLEAALAERPRIPRAAALALLRPVFEAIAFAHRRGVVHRDLKPANIFLVASAAGPVPKVLDFGIAKMVRGALEDAARGATTVGFPAFSPDYGAPEQFSRGRTGPWTDVHALALLLTELVTGRPPYPAGDEDRLGQIMAERRPTPGSKGVQVRGWEPVLARAMALRPSERYPSAEAFLQALDAPTDVRRRRGPWIALALAVALALSLRALRPAPALAVLFENATGDGQQDYLAEGLAEAVISQLGRSAPGRLAVVRPGPRGRLGRVGVREVARLLHVGHVLEGKVERGGSGLTVTARLIRAADESPLWTGHYDRPASELAALAGEMTPAVVGALRVPAAWETAGARRRSVSANAYDAYLRARYFANKKTPEGARQARSYFEEAIRIDPGYAAAHAGLAQNYPGWSGEDAARAEEAARRAVALDDTLPEAHSALASVLLGSRWDWAGAERHYRRALELDPNDGETHGWYARIPLALGRFREAIAERRRAMELSPLSLDAHNGVGTAYYMARRYDEAIAQLQRTLELDPASWLPHLFLGCVYAHKGMYAEALAEGEKCGQFPAACLARVTGYTYALAGRKREALLVIDRMKQLAAAHQYVAPLDFARVYAGLNMRDQAMGWLEAAYREHARDLIFLRVDPQWDPIRDDVRFGPLVRRVGLP